MPKLLGPKRSANQVRVPGSASASGRALAQELFELVFLAGFGLQAGQQCAAGHGGLSGTGRREAGPLAALTAGREKPRYAAQ